MRYLDDRDVDELGIDWNEVVRVLQGGVEAIHAGDVAQPIKPYLRYGDRANRIIAMPAYAGGRVSMAGLKWIASFPGNLDKGLPRAHSVTLLNDAETGVPVGVLASTRLSGIRTAGVTALMMRFGLPRKAGRLQFGMTGYGPIGELHLNMLFGLFDDRIERIRIFDTRKVRLDRVPPAYRSRVEFVDCWEKAFDADVFITCTVANAPYIDRAPVAGSLQLNVSLRDYVDDFFGHVRHVVVDDWFEVCRENTDIHRVHLERGLTASDTLSIAQVVVDGALSNRKRDDVVMFNPMGLAVFDVSIGAYYMKLALERSIGTELGRDENRLQLQ